MKHYKKKTSLMSFFLTFVDFDFELEYYEYIRV
jgi:hypothetical protein